ncbi:hypothetical protein H4R34_006456, partial [Dimargaris verticillata]
MAPNNIHANQIPPALISNPDVFYGLPVVPRSDYGDAFKQLLASTRQSIYRAYTDISQGPLGAFNAGYVMETPSLVEEYLDVINHGDLRLSLEARPNELLYNILVNVIELNNPNRARYFFMDIMVFQVIPKLIMAYVSKGYYKQALAFIGKMLSNSHFSDFWKLIKADTDLNYYERAAFT